MTSRSCLVMAWVFALVDTSNSVALRNSTTQHKMETIDRFFDQRTPKKAGTPVILDDIVHLIFQRLRRSLNIQEADARQYYGTTGYGNYFGSTGYGLYGAAGTSSTSFNGLDAGLSALAFLAFGVWLFNLVLPQLQGVGLGLPGLSRRNAPHVASGEVGSSVAQSPGLLSNILSSSQDLLGNIFNKDTSRQSKLKAGWPQTINQTKNTLTSGNTGEPMGIRELASTGKPFPRVASDLQPGRILTKGTTRRPSGLSATVPQVSHSELASTAKSLSGNRLAYNFKGGTPLQMSDRPQPT